MRNYEESRVHVWEKRVDMKDGMKTYSWSSSTRFPIESGMIPFNWLELSQLNMRLVKERIVDKKKVRVTYSTVRLARFPIESGIVPLSWLIFNWLKKKISKEKNDAEEDSEKM